MKKKEIRLAKRINDFDSVNKALFQIETTLNELLEKATQEAEFSGTEGTAGETGDIKIVHNPDKSYSFNIMTGDGWKSPVWKGSEITFKDKPKKEKSVKKSLEDIMVEDENTGTSKAKGLVFDEKNNKTVLARPDYESGWFEATVSKLYTTGATDGVSPNSSAIYDAAHVVGIPALGFELKQLPGHWEVLIAHSGTTSWDDIKNGGTNSWVVHANQKQRYFSAHSDYFSASGVMGILTSKDHFTISTADYQVFNWVEAGGVDMGETTVAMNLRIWK
jgi:hypothetical protein